MEINKDTAIHRDLAFKDTFFKQLCDSIDSSLYSELLSIRVPFIFSEVSLDMLEERLHNFSLVKDDDEVLQNRLSKGITYIVLQLISEYSKSDITLNTNFQSILNKLKNPNVLKNGIKQLANDTGYTHNHLCKLFKKNLNQSINSVLTASRMDYAASLLKNTDFCMLEISALVGYESISHFIATFRKYFGVTPNKFKKL